MENFTIAEWKTMRQYGRTSLLYLCQNVLGYKDVSKEVHGPMVRALQKFKGGKDAGDNIMYNGRASPGTFKNLIDNYQPAIPMWDLEGPRKLLILWPRGHLKTTVATIAYNIQWIINYPNIRILLSSGTGEQVRKILDELISHFRFNEMFRWLYPEFVPHGKNVKEFGNQERFTIPARTVHRKEPTVSICSVGAVVAGGHFDVIDNDDVVDKENCRTPEQILNVNSHLGFLWPLLETAPDADKRQRGYQRGWWSMKGTRYDFCLVGDTRITMADWSQRPIKDVRVGDEVVGWIKENGKRYLRPSKVLKCGRYEAREVNRCTFDSGRSVVCTPEHKWWKGPWTSGDEYKSLGLHYHKMKHVRRLIVALEKSTSRDAGWLAGMYDGEGTIQVNKAPYRSASITICQSMHNPDLIERIRTSLRGLDFDFTENWHSPSKVKGAQAHWKDRCVFRVGGGWQGRYKFLREIAPFRFSRIAASLFAQLFTEEEKLVKMEPAGSQDVYWFQCETGNYIAEGYCSKNSDSYGTIIDSEEEKPEEERSYSIQQQDVIIEGDLSDLKTCKTIWPARMPPQALKDIQDDPLQGPNILASQYRMNPIPDKSGLVDNRDQIVWIPVAMMRKIYAYLTLHVTVDLAGMEPSTNKLADNDFTVITPHGCGHDGTLYILPIMRGRYSPFEVIDMLFGLFQMHPRLMDIKIEKEAHARVLLPFLKREMAKRQKFLPVVEIRRDNLTSKQQRIKGLQPWFRNGSIKFADNQPHKLAIINEIMRFPKYSHDDILDTIADAMQNREGGITSDVLPMAKTQVERPDLSPLAEVLRSAKLFGDTTNEESNVVDSLTGW